MLLPLESTTFSKIIQLILFAFRLLEMAQIITNNYKLKESLVTLTLKPSLNIAKESMTSI